MLHKGGWGCLFKKILWCGGFAMISRGRSMCTGPFTVLTRLVLLHELCCFDIFCLSLVAAPALGTNLSQSLWAYSSCGSTEKYAYATVVWLSYNKTARFRRAATRLPYHSRLRHVRFCCEIRTILFRSQNSFKDDSRRS